MAQSQLQTHKRSWSSGYQSFSYRDYRFLEQVRCSFELCLILFQQSDSQISALPEDVEAKGFRPLKAFMKESGGMDDGVLQNENPNKVILNDAKALVEIRR